MLGSLSAGTKMNKKKALGKDLAALLGSDIPNNEMVLEGENIIQIPLDKIVPNKAQPRRTFDSETIQELAKSIKERGLIQPILVRPKSGTVDEYEIIAGERRWRAAGKALMATIPSLVKEITDEDSSVLALIENIQREELNAYEQAQAMEELRIKHNYTQQQLGDILGMPRASVANLLRLLKLEDGVKQILLEGKLDMGHAKVLLVLEGREQVRAAEEAAADGFSVRQTELLTRKILNKRSKRKVIVADPNIIDLQDELSDKLGVKVMFSHKKGGTGKMIVHYHSVDELEGVLRILKLRKTPRA